MLSGEAPGVASALVGGGGGPMECGVAPLLAEDQVEMLNRQLGYHVVEFCRLTGNAGESESSFGVGEPEAGPIGPEGR